MAISKFSGKHVDVKVWTKLEQMEKAAMEQLKNIASLPWVFHHVAAMPDVHLGKGATVGSVIAMKDAVSPAAVGVDIGCGMSAVQTNLLAKHLPESLARLRSDLEASIPVGFSSHNEPTEQAKKSALWKEFSSLSSKVQDREKKAKTQLGTLGGGNHFVELCLDTEDKVWLMLHSGSRNIGKTLAEIHMTKAKTLSHNQDLPDKDLAVFLAGTPQMEAYRHDLFWAQRYAKENRDVMVSLALTVLRKHFPILQTKDIISCHHNYVAEEVHFDEKVLVTRKGAIRAGKGDMGIIPGSMGTRSYIVRGLGNKESFESASHGAGRKMSRNAARKTFTLEDLEKQTEGIECRKDKGVLDEIPGAYKPIEEVMENQKDLVEIVTELKQVLCMKG